VKLGGSLTLNPEKLKALCIKLSEISTSFKLILVPGGGEFSYVVRDADKRLKLSPEVSHRMAILGMDQYGFLLSDLIKNSCVVNQLEKIQEALDLNKLPIFLPSNIMLKNDPLENSWDVTSDSIAVYVANQLDICKVVLLTDVDGIFTCDPKQFSEAKLISKLSAKQLEDMQQRTSVDKFLPKLLSQLKIECFVVNGFDVNRVEALLKGENVVGTIIS